MSDSPFRGAFPHQHQDPRGLVERIEAQLSERLEEAVDMAALGLIVELRKRAGRPAPDTSSPADRAEFEEATLGLLTHLSEAYRAELGSDEGRALEAVAVKGPPGRPGLLAIQVHLARRLPDYWQRFERHAEAYAESRFQAPAAKSGWLGRLFR